MSPFTDNLWKLLKQFLLVQGRTENGTQGDPAVGEQPNDQDVEKEKVGINNDISDGACPNMDTGEPSRLLGGDGNVSALCLIPIAFFLRRAILLFVGGYRRWRTAEKGFIIFEGGPYYDVGTGDAPDSYQEGCFHLTASTMVRYASTQRAGCFETRKHGFLTVPLLSLIEEVSSPQGSSIHSRRTIGESDN